MTSGEESIIVNLSDSRRIRLTYSYKGSLIHVIEENLSGVFGEWKINLGRGLVFYSVDELARFIEGLQKVLNSIEKAK